MRDQFDRLLRRRQPDARDRRRRERLEALERQREMRSPLVVGHSVDLVDDDGTDVLQHRAASLGCQQDVQRLGRRHEDVRRPVEHGPARGHQRVAGADGGPDLRQRLARIARELGDLGERDLEVFLDVVAQRFERRDVQHFCAVRERAGGGLPDEAVDAAEKGGEGLARPGRRGNQRASPREDVRPALNLRLGGRAEPPEKPLTDERVRPTQVRGLDRHGKPQF